MSYYFLLMKEYKRKLVRTQTISREVGKKLLVSYRIPKPNKFFKPMDEYPELKLRVFIHPNIISAEPKHRQECCL